MSMIQSDTRGNPNEYSGRTNRNEIVRPDAVYGGDGEEFNPLDPCPACDSRPHDAPEGVKSDGSAHWSFPHCWRCGYRPGTNTAVSQSQLRKQWDDFQNYMQDNNKQDNAHPTLNPPKGEDVDALKAQLAEMQLRLSERDSGGNLRQEKVIPTNVTDEPSTGA